MPIPANPRLGATGAQWDHRQLNDGGSHKRSSCEYQSFRIGPSSNLPVISVTGSAAKKVRFLNLNGSSLTIGIVRG